jgi:hypothetical protein
METVTVMVMVMVKGKALREADDLLHERSGLGCGGGC